jgi:DNA replication protein DnaC
VIIPEVTDVKAALTTGLTELRLPTVRHCYEETARLAERETLSYERYLLQLVTRECEDRQRKRIERLLNQSRIPAEKALSKLQLEAAAAKSGADHENLTRRRVPGSP